MTRKKMNRNCEELLLEYAAGTLDEAHALMVATYLTLSPEGRHYVAECESLGGAMIAHLCDPVDVSNDCLEKLLEKIDCASPDCAEKEPCCNETCISCDQALPAPLANLLPPGNSDGAVWKQRGGVSIMAIPLSCRGSHAALMRYAPGATIAPSAGEGNEIILVLEGSLHGHAGDYSRGDLIHLEKDMSVASTTTGCFCLCVTAPAHGWNSLFDRLRRWFSLKA